MITQLEEGEPPNQRRKADQYWPDRFNNLVCSYFFSFVCLIVDLFVSNKRGKADHYKSYNLVCLYNLSLFSQGEKEMPQSVTFLGGIKVNLHLSYLSLD